MRSFPFFEPRQAVVLLRIAVALFMMAHGLTRLTWEQLEGSVNS